MLFSAIFTGFVIWNVATGSSHFECSPEIRSIYFLLESFIGIEFTKLGDLRGWNVGVNNLFKAYLNSLDTVRVLIPDEVISLTKFVLLEVLKCIYGKNCSPFASSNLVALIPDFIEFWKLMCGPLYYSKLRAIFEIAILSLQPEQINVI